MGERAPCAPNAQTTSTASRLDSTLEVTTTTTVASACQDPSTRMGGQTSGESPTILPLDEVTYLDRSSIGEIARMRHLTLTEAISGALGSRRKDSCGDDPLSQALLNAAGLGAARDKLCRDLSRGQVLRLTLCVGVARAIAGRLVGSCDSSCDGAEPINPECELYTLAFCFCIFNLEHVGGVFLHRHFCDSLLHDLSYS